MSAGWRVRRAWPRDNRMDLELLGPRGELLAAVARDDRVDPVGLDDSRLPALPGWDSRPGTTLVVHRPCRRAVLRVEGEGCPSYVKVARPQAVRRAVHAHRTIGSLLSSRTDAPQIPAVEAVGPGDSWFRVSGLPGRSLLDLARDASVAGLALEAAAAAAGRCLAVLAATAPSGLQRWGAEDEMRVLEGWVDRLRRYDPLGRPTTDAIRRLAESATAALLALPARPPVTAPATCTTSSSSSHRRTAAATRRPPHPTGSGSSTSTPPRPPTRRWTRPTCSPTSTSASGRVVRPDRVCRIADALVRARQQAVPAGGAVLEPARVAAYRAAARPRLAALFCFRPRARSVVPLLLDAPEVVAPELGRDHGAAPIPLGAT